MAQKFPNSAARAAMVAELTDELAAATPKHAVKTSDLHLAVENLEEQIAKANGEMHKKVALIGKLQQQGAEIYETVVTKTAKIEELKLEIAAAAANEAAIPPPAQEIPTPTVANAPALLASLRQTIFQNENAAAPKPETRTMFTEFAASFTQVEAMFKKMVELHVAASADIHEAALANGTVQHVCGTTLPRPSCGLNHHQPTFGPWRSASSCHRCWR